MTTTGEINLVDDRTATAADLVQEGAKLVRSYGTLHGKAATTAKKLAVVVLRLRTRYTDKNGRPDLCGTSQEYRDAVRALYDSAGVPTDAASTLQATVRYHVSELRVDYMRANGFTDEDFRYYQIDTESKRARQVAAARERRQALREAASRAEALTPDTRDPAGTLVRVLTQLDRDLRIITEDPEVLSSAVTLVGERRNSVVKSLDAMEQGLAAIRASL